MIKKISIVLVAFFCIIFAVFASTQPVNLNGFDAFTISNYASITNIGNFSFRNAPTECPSGSFMSFFNGSNSICSDISSINYDIDLGSNDIYADVIHPSHINFSGGWSKFYNGNGRFEIFGNASSSQDKLELRLINPGQIDDGTGSVGRISQYFIPGSSTLTSNSIALAISTHINDPISPTQPNHVSFYSNLHNASSSDFSGKAFEWNWGDTTDGIFYFRELNRIQFPESYTGYYQNETPINSGIRSLDQNFEINVDSNGDDTSNEATFSLQRNSNDFFKIINRNAVSTSLSYNEIDLFAGVIHNTSSLQIVSQDNIVNAWNFEENNFVSQMAFQNYYNSNDFFNITPINFNDSLVIDTSSQIKAVEHVTLSPNMTIVMRMKFLGTDGRLFHQSVSTQPGIIIYTASSGRPRVEVRTNSSSVQTSYSGTSIPTNEWGILGITLENIGSQTIVRQYWNGEQIRYDLIDARLTDNTRDLYLGDAFSTSNNANFEIKYLAVKNKISNRNEIIDFNDKYILSSKHRENLRLYENITMYSPNGSMWNCGVNNTGGFNCN